MGKLDGGRWTSLAIIDFGDAMTGDLLYELAALHLDLFHGERDMLAAFLRAYGIPEAGWPELARKALATALLHRFDVFANLPEGVLEGCATLADLAQRVFSPGL